MFLINQSFFVGEINIPNPSHAATVEKTSAFISKYEPSCLLLILGYPLYKAFGSETSQRMTDLLEGAEYTTSNGELKKWNGLVFDTNKSLIAYYVWYFWQKSSITQTTGVATTVQNAESGTSVSPGDKLIFAWNEFSEITKQLLSFLWNHKIENLEAFPEFTQHQYLKTQSSTRKINEFSL